MEAILKLGIVCILIILLSKSGLSQRYPPLFDPIDILQFNEGCSTKVLATVTARGYNGVITISANDNATRAKVDILQTSSDNTVGFSTTVQIKQKACMDRETESVWYLQLLAEDTSNMKTIKTMHIYIIDVNDEHPSFSSKLFQITVSEKTQPSTEVLKVTATDPDNGLGGIVTYTLEPQGPSAALYGNAFGIVASSGSITVKTELDYSKLSFYQYLIVGTDFGGLKGNATLIIKIQSLATTMAPHNTRYPPNHGTTETDNFIFRYDPYSHVMVAITRHKCYVYTTSDTESVDVHTSYGLHQLETKLITMVDSTSATYITMSRDELTRISKSSATICNRVGWTTYKLN